MLFSERLELTVRADLCDVLVGFLLCFTPNGSKQLSNPFLGSQALSQIDPCVERYKTGRKVGARNQDGNYRETAARSLFLGLPVQRKIHLAFLPRPDLAPDEYCNRAHTIECTLERLRPGNTRDQIRKVDERGQPPAVQRVLNGFHRFTIGPVITQKYVN